ncbi:hypothetical protein [Gaoshiqia sediminis]|uniref:Uncharacterized protein n=1 Tax=Gaoshiqia sediminis TaxID=2986998 RepID=A0AA41Y8X9_9BACT|nr:hypothetical protein [Gaoshiqia sediminis]MCW0484065.1 hypothetical protein [Gaoshiqia sediminis]
MVDIKTKQEAAATLTGKGIGFSVEENGKVHHFCIPQLKLGTLIQISEAKLNLTVFDKNAKAVDIISSMATDAQIKARIIALAVINSKPVPERRRSILSLGSKPINPELMDEDELTGLFLRTLDSEETNKLIKVIVKQMGIDDFFVSTVSLAGINLLEMSGTVTSQHSPSGDE